MDSIIELKNANIRQHDNIVLSDVSFNIGKGEFIYLIGKTGSGKSSLLKTLYAELPTYDGIVNVAGYDLTQIKRKEIPLLRRKLGIVFQDFQLLDDRNVEANLEFVLRATGWYDEDDIDRRIDLVLDKVGLRDKRDKMPYNLSGGEQQGITIARALLNNPDVILADEPTGNLDPETALDILKMLLRISDSGTAVLMATHNYGLIQKYPGRIIKCENHQVICSRVE
ncbi:MAG: ATP-binding cassette domain-containing protein [Bacteroidales bacterium]|nr:ATP-binding cassette domain-containing protein [Bacteroidales bacterium]